MTLLCGWSILLGRMSGQQDLVIGSPVANRQRADTEGLIGFFVNTLALRVRPQAGLTVAALLDQVRAMTLAAYAHQELPFEHLVEALQPERSLDHNPLVQVMLALNNTPGVAATGLAGLELAPLDSPQTMSKCDMTLSLGEVQGELVGTIEYASDLFDAASVERIAARLETVLGAMVGDEQCPVGALALLPQAERALVLHASNQTDAAYPDALTIQECFQARVALHPDAPAVAGPGQTLSYRELNARANGIARRLLALGVRADDTVAICLERSVELVAACSAS